MKKLISILGISLLFYSNLSAKIEIGKIFGDNMVLQREIDVPIWGWGDIGEKVNVEFNGQKVTGNCDNKGKWTVKLEPMKAGGPFNMIITGDNTIELKNILIGDVWICSGQSNMWRPVYSVTNAEKEIKNANYPQIRIYSVPRTFSIEPQEKFMKPHPDEQRIATDYWTECTPESIRNFTAVGYFFGKKLFEELDVPIGLIKDCWGSTKVEPWMRYECLANSKAYEEEGVELIDPILVLDSVSRGHFRKIEEIIDQDKGMKDNKAIWAEMELNDKEWKDIDIPQSIESIQGKNWDGIIWFRRHIYLPDEIIKNSFTLSLGRVINDNFVWINGEMIGETKGKLPGSPFYGSDASSKYKIAKSILKGGKNVITVRVKNYSGKGGFIDRDENLYLKTENFKLSLAGNWKYNIGLEAKGETPKRVRPHQYNTVLFNAMINPLIPYGIKGVIWYQGESNTGSSLSYYELFPLMINDWRELWGQGDFAFMTVQLANFREPPVDPANDGWAILRDAQYQTTMNLPNAGIAVTIDIGEADNIHPANKQDVGKRLALAALKITYGKDIVHSGPTYKEMKIEGDKIRLYFDNVGSGLMLKDRYGYPNAFAIAGKDKKFKWAHGYLEDNTIVLYNREIEEPVAVRYAWSNNPEDANLYNKEGLPAVPFRTDDWDLSFKKGKEDRENH